MDSVSDASVNVCLQNVSIKKERLSPAQSSSDEMKQEFAETAMNELLGWYGYETGTRGVNSAPAEDDFDADDDDIISKSRYRHSSNSKHHRNATTGDSSGPEYSDSGGANNRWCGWCNRPITGQTSDQISGAFCSELCFSQSRRASFKRNRTCDWCRHVRHTVAHVDVRDGTRHLQFCGDKCLNQYKMHIFCRETRAHLDLHPHHAHTYNLTNTNDSTSLITPELWLKDCRSNSPLSLPPPVVSLEITRHQLPIEESNTVTLTVTSPSPSPSTNSIINNKTYSKNNLYLSSSSPRKRHCSLSRRSAAIRRATRTSTVTSTSSSQLPPDDNENEYYEGPQDLRVRPKSPTKEQIGSNIEKDSEKMNNFWIPSLAPPPITVLVPYPVILPVPLPIPIPIPIPMTDEMIRKFSCSPINLTTSVTTTTTTTTTTTNNITTCSSSNLTSSVTTSLLGTLINNNNNNNDKNNINNSYNNNNNERTLRARKRSATSSSNRNTDKSIEKTLPA